MQDEQTHNALQAIEAALRNTGLLAFSGEMQLLEWTKSTSRNQPTIKFALENDDCLDPFQAATVRKGRQAGQIYHVFVIPVSDDAAVVGTPNEESTTTKKPLRKPNYLARQLHQSGYFRRVSLWDKLHTSGIYSKENHSAHIANQPCFFCKEPSTRAVKFTASPWILLPTCETHADTYSTSPSNIIEMARVYALTLMEEAAKAAMKHAIGIDSLAELTPVQLNSFNKAIGFE